MRTIILLLAAAGGCKTAEFAVDHSMTGIHVAAKFEARDASDELSFDGESHWNGGEPSGAVRR